MAPIRLLCSVRKRFQRMMKVRVSLLYVFLWAAGIICVSVFRATIVILSSRVTPNITKAAGQVCCLRSNQPFFLPQQRLLPPPPLTPPPRQYFASFPSSPCVFPRPSPHNFPSASLYRTGVPKKISAEALEFTINALIATRGKLEFFLSKVPADALVDARAEIKSEGGSES